MNIIEKLIFDESKKNQYGINKLKILGTAILFCIFCILYLIYSYIALKFFCIFSLIYLGAQLVVRYYLDRIFRYFSYINISIDIVGILILVYIFKNYSRGIYISTYFPLFLVSIIIASSIGFQKFYTIIFGIFSILITIYIFYIDGILDSYTIFVIFFLIVIYLIAIYNIFHLKKVISNTIKLKQLEKFTSKDFIEKLDKNPELLNQKGDKKRMVIFFLDIKGFTSLSEKYSGQEIFEMLNDYLGSFAQIIEQNGGVVDKYIGDSIMGYFEGVDMFKNSYKASILILEKLDMLNKVKKDNIKIGIGMHYGRVFAGSMGYSNRMNYTIIGDSVNISSRLESLTRNIDGTIAVSKNYYDKLDFINKFELSGEYELKGKNRKVIVYKI